MKLYLVQHGKAYSKEVNQDRPLTEQGGEDVDRLGAFLCRAGIRVERVIHSGKLRAEQTAMRLAKAIAPGVELETSDIINPNDNPAAFDWQSDSLDKDTLIVSHLPFLARLVSDLVTGDADKPIIAYQPGSMVCLERETDANWRINWMIRPELLG